MGEDDGMIWKGNPKLEPLLVPIESVTTHPRNPRRGDLPLLAESLDSFGQTRPIVVQPETDWIVAGNHTMRAALEVLGWTHIAVVRPVLEGQEYEQYLLMDNKASDASEYDDEVLIPILQRLTDRGDFAHTGWDPDQAEDFIAASDRVARTEEAEFRGGYAESDAERQERESRAQAQGRVDQLMLAYSGDTYTETVQGIRMLEREYGTSGIAATVAHAVEQQFLRVFNEGQEVEPDAV